MKKEFSLESARFWGGHPPVQSSKTRSQQGATPHSRLMASLCLAIALLLSHSLPTEQATGLALEWGRLRNYGIPLYDFSVISSEGEFQVGTFPSGTEVQAPAGAFTAIYREAPGGPVKRRVFGASQPQAEARGPSGRTGAYHYLPADFDTSDSRWLDDQTYLLAVRPNRKMTIRVFHDRFIPVEISFSENGPQERYRRGTSAVSVWGQSEQAATPRDRAYWFLTPSGIGPWQVFIQAVVDGRVSLPVAFTFDRPKVSYAVY